MSEEVKGLIFDAVKVTIVAVISFPFASWLEDTFPDLPDWLLFAIPAFLIALLVSFIWLKLTSTAHLRARWHQVDDLAVERAQIVVKLDSATGEAETGFWLSVHREQAAGLGKLALRLAVRAGLRVRVTVLHTSMSLTPEHVARDPAEDRVIPGNDCSIEFVLTPPPPGMGAVWASTRVNFQGLTPRPPADWTVDYAVTSSTAFGRLCGRLVKVDARAASVIENWR